MTDKDLWTTFEKTGRIVDYLQYKEAYGGAYQDYFTSRAEGTEKNQAKENQVKENLMGEESVESDSNSDRHDTIRSTYRGI